MHQVKLSVRNRDMRCYLHYLFSCNESIIKVSRNHDIGLLLTSLVCYQNNQDTREGEDIVVLDLPSSCSTRSATYKYCYYSREAEAKINDILRVYFNMDLHSHFLQGTSMSLSKRIVVESFIISRGLVDVSDDTLGKRYYRYQSDQINKKVRRYLDKCYLVEMRIKNNINNY